MIWVLVMVMVMGVEGEEPAAVTPGTDAPAQGESGVDRPAATSTAPRLGADGEEKVGTGVGSAGGMEEKKERQRLKWSDFEVIASRNMFVTRSKRVDRAETSAAPPPPVAPPAPVTRPWMFAGSAISSADKVAFLMDGTNNETIRVREGDSIDAGKIVKIGPAELEIESGGTITTLGMGESLTGTGTPSTSTTTTTTTTGKAAEPAKTGSGSTNGTMSIEEKMRARRLQELGQ